MPRKKEPKTTKEERRELAMAYGVEVNYLKCPLCQLNKVLHKKKKGRQFFKFYENPAIIQIRKGGSRGSGFWKVGEVLLEDLKSHDEELFENLKKETQKLLVAIEELK